VVGMSFLITGCGRSGTKYMAECLRLAGLDVGHERMGRDGAVSSIWCAPHPPYPKYHQQGLRPQFDVILHQVREPLATIASCTTGSDESWRFNQIWVPIKAEWPPVKRAAHYWYWWNKRAEAQAKATYRIENLRAQWPVIMALIGHDADYTGDEVSKRTNSRKHMSLTWERLSIHAPAIVKRVWTMSQRYGYEYGDRA